MTIKRDGRTGIWSAMADSTTHQAATLAALVAILEKAGVTAP